MLSVRFISNTEEKLIDILSQLFGNAEEIDMAVAFVKSSGYRLIEDTLVGKRVRILLGFDFWLTDVEPLLNILKKGYACKIYRTPLSNHEKSYHTKIYIAKGNDTVQVIIGSSNLTNGGLCSNVEANVLLSGNKGHPEIQKILEFFEQKWKSSLAQDIDEDLINEYTELKSEYDTHVKRLDSQVSFISKRDKIRAEGNSIIICMTKDHDRGDIYDRLVGVPINAKKIAFQNIRKGTRMFIYYIGEGISKVVEALGNPYLDETVVSEWEDGLPETYPVRIKTRLLNRYTSSIKLTKLRTLGVSRLDTGRRLVSFHLRSSVTPISDNDGDTIQGLLH